jgi:predicted dienelactone hydrolase
VRGVLGGVVALLGLLGQPAIAADQVSIRLGPVRQTIPVSDLEHFAETGEVPESLQLYESALTPDVQNLMNSRLTIDPEIGEKLIDNLLDSSAGERLLDTLQIIIPNSDPQILEETLVKSTQESEGFSLLGFIKAFPKSTINVDAAAVISVASQMNLPYWQSQVLRSVLERELTVETTERFHAPFDPTESGFQTVYQQTLSLHDRTRDRNIPVDLYWSDWTRGPLVVISHGFGSDRRFLDYLAEHLASYGFTVAALEHPGSNVAWLNGLVGGKSADSSLAEILPPTEFIDRPQDIRFLLDELERLNQDSALFQGKLNTDQVVLIGHSLGGYTALAVAGAELDLSHLQEFCLNPNGVGFSPADWLQCSAAELSGDRFDFRDERVKAVIALNPVMGRTFDAESLSHITIPTLILSGTDDPITPAVSQQLLPFTELQASPKYLVTVIGGTHLSVGDPANFNQAVAQAMFMHEMDGQDTESLRQLLRGLSLAFVKQLTPEAELYQPFLTSEYVQSFSSDKVRLRLNQELPDNLTNWLRIAVGPLEQLVANTTPKPKGDEDAAQICESSLSCIRTKLPLLMVVMPSNLALVVQAWLRRYPRRWRSRRRIPPQPSPEA